MPVRALDQHVGEPAWRQRRVLDARVFLETTKKIAIAVSVLDADIQMPVRLEDAQNFAKKLKLALAAGTDPLRGRPLENAVEDNAIEARVWKRQRPGIASTDCADIGEAHFLR